MVREEFVLLSCFVRELSQLTGQPIPYSTRKLYAMALDNEIPVEKRNGRWGVSRQQLPAVAEALALPVPQQHAHAA